MPDSGSLPVIVIVALVGIVLAVLLLPSDMLDVRPDRGPPVADAGPDITVTLGEGAVLDGSGSSDDKGVRQWVWEIAEGPNVVYRHGETVTHFFERPGEYQVTLEVTDAAGNADTDQVLITVLGP